MFITFEGIDKSGKTTQSKFLIERLSNLGYTVKFLREPGGTKISEKIRDILLDIDNKEMFPATEFLLYSASRAQLVNEVIIPALNNNEVIVCDRYYDSSLAYQGFGRGIDLNIINFINNFAAPVKPDLTFFMDIHISELNHRTNKMYVQKDRLEISGDSFFNKVREGYLSIAQNEPDRFVVIDGSKPKDEISSLIWLNVSKKLGISK
ncbi:MAG TPA: dTMP kinase [Bacteroidota bacterium]|jgi:dTMP kinase|nr:dTMP kinase [Bacteroidota bacterium]